VGTEVVIALGSNLGSTRDNLDQAVKALQLNLDNELLVSRYWQSEPMNMAATAAQFLNAVISATTTLNCYELLRVLQKIETGMGRIKDKTAACLNETPTKNRRSKHGRSKNSLYHSRIIDLDIIAFGNLELNDSTLIVPHPRAKERLFVLLPLEDVNPRFQFPGEACSLSELIDQAPKMDIVAV